MKVDVYSTNGRKLSKITLSKEIFGVEPNKVLMAQAVRVYLANQRKAKAKTKGRSEVRGSGKKIWRQKGTGRARHGDRKAPIFIKGGIAHGPTGKENFKLKMSKKMKRRALFSALSNKFKSKEIIVINGLDKVKPKTKEIVKIIKGLKLGTKNKITFVLPSVIDNVIRAGRNISNVNFLQARLLNTYKILNGGFLVFMKPSVKAIEETFLRRKKRN